MVRRTISVKFYARKGRSTAAGLAPVCMRIYMGDQKFETNTKIYVKAEEWKHEKVKGTNEEAKRVNKCIEGFKMKAFDARLKPSHISLFTALCRAWLLSDCKSHYHVSRRQLMRASHLHSKTTYHKTISDLQRLGYILTILD